jgi:hypothetical protein
MNVILVNAFKSSSGGGKTIFNNFILTLNDFNHITNNTYIIIKPFNYELKGLNSDRIKFISPPYFLYKNQFSPIFYFIYIPYIINKYKIKSILNFGDIIIPLKLKQLYFFDWAYAVYNEKYIWKNMFFFDYLKRKFKLFLIKLFLNKNLIVLVQTNVIKTRFNSSFNVNNILVFPTPVNIDKSGNYIHLNLKKNLYKYYFYPASYAPHKNFKIFDSLSNLINFKNSNFKIILTLNKADYDLFIKNKNKSQIDVFINIGIIDNSSIYSIYEQIDFLLFPSFLESYGLPLLESIFYNRPVLCSDLDFSRELCGENAFYFDPFDANSIFNQMNFVSTNISIINNLLNQNNNNMKSKTNWKNLIELFNEVLN